MTMEMPLLPQWLRVAWAAILAVVLVLHLVHATTMRSDTRRWHVGHILMSGGMITMYVLPQSAHPDLYQGGVAVFGVLTIAAGISLSNDLAQTKRPSWLWLATMLDMAIMTYMSTSARHWVAVITYLAVAYLVVEAVLWITARIPDPVGPAPAGELHEQQTPGSVSRGGVQTLTRPIVALWHNRPESDVTSGVRVTLAVMSLSMIWMLIAMQNMHMIAAVTPGMHM